MSSPAKALAVLDLFTIERPIWTLEEINARLGYSRPSGYRYVKELVDAGLLRRQGVGTYVLGMRIIQMDYQIRHTDPLLHASDRPMAAIVAASGFDATLTAVNGNALIDIHRVSFGDVPVIVRYGRGRPRPMFRGAAAKVLLAHSPAAQMVRTYAEGHAEIQAAGMGSTFEQFSQRLAEIRRDGWCITFGELTPSIGAASVAVLHDGDAVAALSLVGEVTALQKADPETLRRLLVSSGQQVEAGLKASHRS